MIALRCVRGGPAKVKCAFVCVPPPLLLGGYITAYGSYQTTYHPARPSFVLRRRGRMRARQKRTSTANNELRTFVRLGRAYQLGCVLPPPPRIPLLSFLHLGAETIPYIALRTSGFNGSLFLEAASYIAPTMWSQGPRPPSHRCLGACASPVHNIIWHHATAWHRQGSTTQRPHGFSISFTTPPSPPSEMINITTWA